MNDIKKNLNMLGTIATISPLLGLLGTVVGMITAFTGLTETSGANPDLLAAGISQALITTAFGLMIAVPGLVLHKYFEQKITYLLISNDESVLEKSSLKDLKYTYLALGVPLRNARRVFELMRDATISDLNSTVNNMLGNKGFLPKLISETEFQFERIINLLN